MFRKTGTLEKDETILVTINGIGHVRVNGELFPAGKPVVVPAGDYRLTVSVNNLCNTFYCNEFVAYAILLRDVSDIEV